MKKVFALLLALALVVMSFSAMAEGVKMGQALYAAHGTKCFTVCTVAVEGDVIVGAHIEEFQFMDAEGNIGVPNSDSDFGASFPEGKVLGSKRLNSKTYSANMTAKAGSTVSILDNFKAIETFVVGKTITELETFLAATTTDFVDAVSGCTLVDTYGYLSGLLLAAQNAVAE